MTTVGDDCRSWLRNYWNCSYSSPAKPAKPPSRLLGLRHGLHHSLPEHVRVKGLLSRSHDDCRGLLFSGFRQDLPCLGNGECRLIDRFRRDTAVDVRLASGGILLTEC